MPAKSLELAASHGRSCGSVEDAPLLVIASVAGWIAYPVACVPAIALAATDRANVVPPYGAHLTDLEPDGCVCLLVEILEPAL